MANKQVFDTLPNTQSHPLPDTVNRSGMPAYGYDDRQRLAQVAMTGTFNFGFYTDGATQVADLLAACEGVDSECIAKTAIYARRHGYMKDAPALLLAVLSNRDPALFKQAFAKVVDNGRMLRNFVQIMRSGVTGRRSLGSAPKHAVQAWLNEATDWQLLNASVGNNPSLADIIKMVHPKPVCAEREALLAYFIGKPCDAEKLPAKLRDYLAYKAEGGKELPDVPFQLLTALRLNAWDWYAIARRATWQTVRMNLNTFARNRVFEVPGATAAIEQKLVSRGAIARAKAMPYQLMAAATALDGRAPPQIREALHFAMEVAVGNAPLVKGQVVICPDVSGSMSWPVTGFRKGATTHVRCVDVAALVAAAILRQNHQAQVMPFDTQVYRAPLRPKDSVVTNARLLAQYGGGGTDCSAPLRLMNEKKMRADLVVFVSDNESWANGTRRRYTALMEQWVAFKKRNRRARLVCLDITPDGTTQAAPSKDILNIGGFSDKVFDVIARFARGENGATYWAECIDQTEV